MKPKTAGRKKSAKAFAQSIHNVEVRTSTLRGAGRGVFAGMPIAVGDRLRVTGFLVRRGSLADRCTHFADPYKFRIGKNLLIPSGYGGLINHSTHPNLVKIIRGNSIFLQAIRPINSGEELFHSYGRDALKRFRRKPVKVPSKRLRRTFFS